MIKKVVIYFAKAQVILDICVLYVANNHAFIGHVILNRHISEKRIIFQKVKAPFYEIKDNISNVYREYISNINNHAIFTL